MEMVSDIEEEKKCICPNCGEKMQKSPDGPDTLYVCEKCGCTIEATEQNLDASKACPNCNHLLEDGNECSYCGYDLGSDFD